MVIPQSVTEQQSADLIVVSPPFQVEFSGYPRLFTADSLFIKPLWGPQGFKLPLAVIP
jgi:hypothetical protein